MSDEDRQPPEPDEPLDPQTSDDPGQPAPSPASSEGGVPVTPDETERDGGTSAPLERKRRLVVHRPGLGGGIVAAAIAVILAAVLLWFLFFGAGDDGVLEGELDVGMELPADRDGAAV